MDKPEEEQVAEALDALEQQVESLKGKGVGGLLGGMVLGRARRTTRRPRFTAAFRRLGLGLLIVVLSVATCSWGVDPSTLTEAWGPRVPASTEDAARALTRGAAVLQTAPQTGSVRFTLTEAEATSALSIGLMLPELMRAADAIPQEEIQRAPDLEALRERIWAEADRQREAWAEQSGWFERVLVKVDPKIRTGDIQVRFEGSGEVVVAGYVQAWAFRLPGLFVVAPHASDGVLELDFVSGRLGRLPLPEFAFDWMAGMAVRAILLGRDYAEISEISVADGSFTFAARVAD